LNPRPMGFWAPYPWYFDPNTHGISNPQSMECWPPTYGISKPYPWYFDPPSHGIANPYLWYFDPPTHNISNPIHGILNPLPMEYRFTIDIPRFSFWLLKLYLNLNFVF
jgi:hypothetical protein